MMNINKPHHYIGLNQGELNTLIIKEVEQKTNRKVQCIDWDKSINNGYSVTVILEHEDDKNDTTT